jgi:hypothetical protein
MGTNQYDKAALINELDETFGKRTGGKLIKPDISQRKIPEYRNSKFNGQIQANPKRNPTTFR